MTDQRTQYEHRLVESALREKLSGSRPPDLTKRILAASENPPQPAHAVASRWGRLRTVSLIAVSASLLLAVACGSWLLSAKHNVWKNSATGGVAVHWTAGVSEQNEPYEGVFTDRYDAERGRRSYAKNNLKQINVALRSRSEQELRELQTVNSQSIPSPYYLSDDVQYLAAGDELKAVKRAESLQMMVTPRIVIQDEEQLRASYTAERVSRLYSQQDVKEAEELLDLYSQQDVKEAEELLDKLVAANEAIVSEFDVKREAEIARLTKQRAQLREDLGHGPGEGGDKYERIVENQFLRAIDNPLSTFSIDVDTASYSKTRMYLLENRMLPPPDAVRIEELVNYFDYDYDGPADEHPFAAHLEAAECPWNPKHRLVRIALKGREIEDKRPASNLVFLLDVSGSMDQPNKLPLVQRGMSMLARELGENDRVAIVVYAGAAGLVLPSTPGSDQTVILEAINRLHAGGSTNGGEGLQLAYQTALDHFIAGGVNRVILCTDGDFNVGVTSPGEITRLAEEHAKAGVYLSVLGFGMGNHNDAMLEEISGKANGNYAFIDTQREARKVLVEQMSGTLVTIAKDVKIQVEFNPVQVAAYRLIGYENRILAAEDFNDDKKDAGEIGAGHTVTALYEIVPVAEKKDESKSSDKAETATPPAVDDLKYQSTRKLTQEAESAELLTLKLRYKQPDAETSTLMTRPLAKNGDRFSAASRDFQFAASVAAFGMILRGSQFKGDGTLEAVEEIAESAKGEDRHGYRAEFLKLVKAAQELGAR